MSWIRSFEGLIDFLSVVIVHAPDDFFEEDFLSDDEQLTLESSFEGIREGMTFVRRRIQDEAVIMQLENLLDDSLAAYRQGDDVRGAGLLQRFEEVLIKKGT